MSISSSLEVEAAGELKRLVTRTGEVAIRLRKLIGSGNGAGARRPRRLGKAAGLAGTSDVEGAISWASNEAVEAGRL